MTVSSLKLLKIGNMLTGAFVEGAAACQGASAAHLNENGV